MESRMMSHEPFRRVLPTLAAATLMALLIAPPAMAYSYRGPRTAVPACAMQLTCQLDSGQFAAVSIKGRWTPTPDTPLITFEPGKPVARGGALLNAVSLVLSRSGGELKLNVRRGYSDGGRSYQVDYPVTDPLAVALSAEGAVDLDLTVYMSQSQAWIESRQGSNSLSTVWTIPLFFGFGPQSATTTTVRLPSGAPSTRQYYTADKRTLIADVNKNYADFAGYTPFLFQGPRSSAAALASAVVDGAGR